MKSSEAKKLEFQKFDDAVKRILSVPRIEKA
jgi:hypothetical protein